MKMLRFRSPSLRSLDPETLCTVRLLDDSEVSCSIQRDIFGHFRRVALDAAPQRSEVNEDKLSVKRSALSVSGFSPLCLSRRSKEGESVWVVLLQTTGPGRVLSPSKPMEVLEHRTGGAVGADLPPAHNALGLNAADAAGSAGEDQVQDQGGLPDPDLGVQQEEETGEAAGALDLFHPAETDAGERERRGRPSLAAAAAAGDALLRCQVKITTRRNLHLRIANHTARDVYSISNLKHCECKKLNSQTITSHPLRFSSLYSVYLSVSYFLSLFCSILPLSPGVVALKEAVHLSQLEAPPTEAEQRDPGPVNAPAACDEFPPPPVARVSMETSNSRPQTSKPKKEVEVEEEEEESSSEALTISELVYSPCASLLPTPVADNQGGVDLLFSSPAQQSPAWLLRELHADPDIQAQLEAERERDRAFERARLAGGRGGRVGGALSSGIRLLSSNRRVNACLLSVARFVAVVMGVLLVAVPTLLLLLESDIDVSFLHEIRQTPEFEQFHYEYYCPLRRWALCKVSLALENLWSD
ncbi:unnamed protein product [Merluccius merluccius]